MPGWLHDAAHSAGGINGDRAVLLVIVAFTLIMVHLINSCIVRLVLFDHGSIMIHVSCPCMNF